MDPKSPDPLTAQTLRRRTGLADVRVFPRLRSTQTRAAELIEAGKLKLPAAILASRQTAGRGQGANSWWSDAGSLVVTFALAAASDTDPDQPAPLLSLRAGLILRSVIASHIPNDRLQLKWPNDLVVDRRKLAGVLCECLHGVNLIGMGINVTTDFTKAPADVVARATSISSLTSNPPSRSELFIALAVALRQELTSPRPRPGWHEDLNRVHALHHRPVAINTGTQILRGLCEGVDPTGRLLVREGQTLHRLITGRVVE